MDHVIGHIDLDYFYAQVEEVENPSIRGRPVIVCVFSGRTEDSGVVSTSNYVARNLGVKSGMPIVLAKKKLQGTEAVIVRMEHEKYEAVSERIMESLSGQVDELEQTGIDEAFFDLTESTNGDYEAARRIAEKIKETIMLDEHLTCSIGIARSKSVAKLGSDSAKPGGLSVISPSATESFLSPLPVTKLYGVGPKTADLLGQMNVKTAGDLSRADPGELGARFGRKLAAYLLAASTGTDDDPIVKRTGHAQFTRIITLKRNTKDPQEAFSQFSEAFGDLHGRLVETGKSFKTISAIGILTDLTTHTKSKTFEVPVGDSAFTQDLILDLFTSLSRSVQKDFRRVGLRLSVLTQDESQKSLSEYLEPVK